jgi:hypothetical protein
LPARLAARHRVAAVIFNDAGIGRDRAGVAGLGLLAGAGIPAAAVDHRTARIGDGADTLRRGRLSVVNELGAVRGWRIGLPVGDAVREACEWEPEPCEELEPLPELRQLLASDPVPVWAIDSASLAGPRDAGCVLATGSHGGLLGGRPESALRGDALAALFNDAGVGIDAAGIARLGPLDERGIIAATVSCESARIGDGGSTYHDGIVSAVNETARVAGARPGMPARALPALVAVRQQSGGR